MSSLQALVRNVGTWSLMLREMTSGKPPRGRIPMQVMAVERRGGVIRLLSLVNRYSGGANGIDKVV